MSAHDEKSLQKISDAVQAYDDEGVADAVEKALGEGASADDVRDALFRGIDSRRRSLMSPSGSLPEYLLSMEALTKGLKIIGAKAEGESGAARRRVVLGVIVGDVHDMGKNIIASVYHACGWEVMDLGAGATPAQFADAAVETEADLVGISCMMSTPLDSVKTAVMEVRNIYPKAALMVGGAAISREMASSAGADGWAESAVTLLEETEKALKSRG